MKIKIGDKVYLQRCDGLYIINNQKEFSDNVVKETNSDNNRGLFFMPGDDRYRFDFVYENPENVKWLMEQAWILDYDKYAKKRLAKLEARQKQLMIERLADVNDLGTKNKAYKRTHVGAAFGKSKKLKYGINSLEALIRFRRGEVEFTFPDGYQEKTSIFKKLKSFFSRRSCRNGAQ